MYRIFKYFIPVLFVSLPLYAIAQKAEGTRHVVIVLPRAEGAIEAAFRDDLSKRHIAIRYTVLRFSGKAEDGPALVETVRALKPDLIYSWGTPTTLALAGEYDTRMPEKYIRDIPIVFAEVTTPLGARLLAKMADPGRNVTGVTHIAGVPIQLNAIRAYRPFKTLAYITNPAEKNTILIREALEKEGRSAGFTIINETISLDANGSPDSTALPEIIKRLASKKPDFLYIGPSTFIAFTNRDMVTQATLAAGLPTFCATETIVRQSHCLFGLISSEPSIGRFAAYKAAQILIERMPIEHIPAETLARFSLVINLPVAKALNFYPPLQLLDVAESLGADEPAAMIVPALK